MSAVGPKGTCLCYLAAVGGKADVSQQLPNNRDLSVPALVALPRFAFQQLHQSPRILRRRALLVVVEIDEHRPPLPLPFANVARPGAQASCPDNDPCSGRSDHARAHRRGAPSPPMARARHDDRTGRATTSCSCRSVEDVVRVPALVLETRMRTGSSAAASSGTTPAAHGCFETAAAAGTAPAPALGASGLEPRLHQRDRIVGLFAQPLPVRDEFRRLPGKTGNPSGVWSRQLRTASSEGVR